ncbi:diaminopimelate decarboxylase [Halomarina oriensis]|uniref:Diaminopimelate decarboxylase n=1 Tax=Halomarina oriensis TaxID=671145 RepID=A0A6B0GKQ5_9EURY|nr:diaminopimelate decarboxylase [Halomarina oriensis]MWG35200.1 diaminopimelate decarboxylase [Halomarina oriensis]
MSGSDTDAASDATPPVRRPADWDTDRLQALAEAFGTPLYVLDPERVRQNAVRLKRAFPDATVDYAVKANTTRRVLETVADAGLGAECASAGEVRRALDAGFPAERVRYTAVNPPATDLDSVVDWWREGHDLTVTVGARDTLDALAERGYDGRLCVRVNPGVGAGHHAKVTTGDAPQFGVPFDRATEVCGAAADVGAFVGLHAHVGSGVSGEELSAHEALVARMATLADEVRPAPEFVSVGGGFGVPYHREDPPLDLEAVAEATREAFDCDARLVVEPGRYVVADAGVLLTEVTSVKPTDGTTVVGVDAGMTTLLRPAMYDAYHEIRSLSADVDDRSPEPCLVAGPVCETSDVLGEKRVLPAPERGDLLSVGTAGAYGYEMASTYNSRPRPAVVTLDGDTVVRRETLADLTRLESDGGAAE